MNSAAKLKNAAQNTAASGLSTRVPTIVAMEFAESWKPLMKSKRKATAMIATTYQTTAAQAFLMEMLCTALATPMHRSIAISSVSYTSFHRITSIGSGVPANSAPTASW